MEPLWGELQRHLVPLFSVIFFIVQESEVFTWTQTYLLNKYQQNELFFLNLFE